MASSAAVGAAMPPWRTDDSACGSPAVSTAPLLSQAPRCGSARRQRAPAAPAAVAGTLAATVAALLPKAVITGRPPGIEAARLFGNINKYAYYYTDLLIGSPTPQVTSVIVDTGSHLVGFPCRGCDHCGRHIDAPFDISASTSARWLPCDSSCSGKCTDEQCTYEETYSEGSSIAGRWFDDVVALGELSQHNPQVRARMGCHENENKLFYTQRANGIMGLAPWGASFNSTGRPTILQDLFKDKQHVSTQLFAMCFATWGGELTVGGWDPSYHLPGAGVKWTPMRASHYYFVFPEALTLSSGVTVGLGSESVTQVAMGNSEFGVAIIDSGTTYAYLPSSVYYRLVKALDAACDPVKGGCGGATREGDCFRLPNLMTGPDEFPTMTIRFRGGVDVEWEPRGYLHERGEQGVWCQTFMENTLYQTVLGISWMLHKDIIFDIDGGRLGIAKAKCPEHHKESDYIRRDEIAEGRISDAFRSLPSPPQLRGGPPLAEAGAAAAAVAGATRAAATATADVAVGHGGAAAAVAEAPRRLLAMCGIVAMGAALSGLAVTLVRGRPRRQRGDDLLALDTCEGEYPEDFVAQASPLSEWEVPSKGFAAEASDAGVMQ